MKRFLITSIFLLCVYISFALNNHYLSTADGTWGNVANWSQGTVPTASDGYVTQFDATSHASCILSANQVCNIIDFTGYTGTFNIPTAYSLTVSGNVTLGLGMITVGTGTLVIAANSTLTSNGITMAWNFTQGNIATLTLTLADNASINGLFTMSSSNGVIGGLGKFLTCNGGFYFSANEGASGNNASIVVTGGTIQSQALTTGLIRNPLTFNSSGTVVLGTYLYYTGTITYTAGIVTTTGNTLYTSTATFNTYGMTWNNMFFSWNATTWTLTSELDIAGKLFPYVYSGQVNTITAATPKNLNLSGTQELPYMNFTRINATGKTLWLYGTGCVINTCTNIYLMPLIPTQIGTISLQ